MIKAIQQPRILAAFLFMGLALGGLHFLGSVSSLYHQHPFFAVAISIDFTLVLPLVYLLFIRKTSIPKVTVVPVFIVCLVVAIKSIPMDAQYVLRWVKFWVLPLVELSVLSFVGYKFYLLRKAFKQQNRKVIDFYDALQEACNQAFPGLAGKLLASELSMLYYSFIAWGKPSYQENEFTIHKQSGVLVVLSFIIGLVVIETGVLHLLLQEWNAIVAWVLTGLSVYSGFQIFGFIKSIPRRPVLVSEDSIQLRFGMMAQVDVPFTAVKRVDLFKKELPEGSPIVELSPLGPLSGGHNARITLKRQLTLEKLFGRRKNFEEIVFFVDDAEQFVELVNKRMDLVQSPVKPAT